MQSVASVTQAPKLTAIFERVIREGGMSPQSEKAMFDQLQRMEEWLVGNGTPGVLTRMRMTEETLARMLKEREAREAEIATERRQAIEDKRQSEKDKKDGFLYRLVFQGASVAVALVLGAVFTNYINHTPSPVDKKLDAKEEQLKADSEKRLDSMEDALARIEKNQSSVPPTTTRPTGSRTIRPTARHPAPQLLNMMQELHATKELPSLLFSSMRAPDFPDITRRP